MVLQGEDLKARSYVGHKASLGTLRERIVANLIRHETPGRFRVETGFVHNQKTGIASKQCDLLIHNPSDYPPLYRWDDFVVVQEISAQAVIEVKSELDSKGFEALMDVHRSICILRPIPVFGYGLAGVRFQTFLQYLSDEIVGNKLGLPSDRRVANLPHGIVVQQGHYLGFRPSWVTEGARWTYFAINLEAADHKEWSNDGIETGIFLNIFRAMLDSNGVMDLRFAATWFNEIPVAARGKVWIDSDGKTHEGRFPTGEG
jgi:hypothetical protein